jgi:hypothetical protein
MKNRLFKTLFTLLLVVSMHQISYAGFPIGNGRWLLVPTYTHYAADGYWDSKGIANNFTNTGRYQSNYLGLYGGYGIGRDLDFVFNVPYVSQSYIENGSVLETLSSVGDMSFGLSYFINHFDYYKHLSITGSVIIPGYPNIQNTYLLPGFSSPGFEAKIGLAGTNTNKLKDVYYDIEGGFRTYFNAGGPNVLFANATMGVPLDAEDWKMSGTLNVVSASSSVTSTNTAYNPYINRNFNYFRGTLALGRRLDRNIALWASIFADFSGTSIGQGKGFSIFAVIKF